MRRNQASVTKVARYEGFRDDEGRFVPFALADEIQRRAHTEGVRVLLRLDVAGGSELRGSFYRRTTR